MAASSRVSFHDLPPILPNDVRALQLSARVLGWLAAAALLACLLLWGVRQPIWALRAIVIDNEVVHTSPSAIRAVIGPRLKGNFLTMDLNRTREAFEAVPWVRQAVVRRAWPMRLHVQIDEHREAAIWGPADGEERLVNTHGEVFSAPLDDVVADRLVRLVGPEGSAAQMLGMLRRLKPVLEPLRAGELFELTLSPRGSWRVQLDKGAEIELGRGSDEEVIARVQQFVRMMPAVSHAYPRPLVSADLRHNGGFAVRLMGVTVNATPGPLPPAAGRSIPPGLAGARR